MFEKGFEKIKRVEPDSFNQKQINSVGFWKIKNHINKMEKKMKKVKGLIVTAALMLAAQSSMAYDGQVRMNGFSSEVDALNAGKSIVQQINSGVRTVAAADLNPTCAPMSADNLEVGGLKIQKHWVNSGSSLADTYEAVVDYKYSCEEIVTP